MTFSSKHIQWVLPVLFSAAGLLLVWPLSQLSGLSQTEAWKEALAAAVELGLGTSMVVWLVRAYPTRVGIIPYAFFAGIIAGLLVAYANTGLLDWWAGRHNADYRSWLQRTRPDRVIIALFVTTFTAVVSAMNKRMAALEERFSLQAGAESLHREAELFKLRQQLQPHFLYNSLNAINSLVLISPDRAQEMIGRLSDFLRSSVRRESNDALPVAEELDYLEAYLAIEAVSFGDRLQVTYEKDFPESAKLPPFLLQPLIENAIKFGLYGRTGAVEIFIRILQQDSLLTISISNPFDPLVKPPSGTGFGLEGVRRRLYLLYGRDDLLQTRSDGELFLTTLKIPQLSHVPSNPDR